MAASVLFSPIGPYQILVTMKNMLFISYVDYSNQTDLGIIKKIEGQISAFKKLGYAVDHVKMKGNMVYVNNEPVHQVHSMYGYWIGLPKTLAAYFRKMNTVYDLVYVRKDLFSPWHRLLFSQLKQRASNILLEVPTYPYNMEVRGTLRRRILLFMDQLTNRLLKGKISHVVTTQDFDRIFGIETIRIRNGYDFSGMRPVEGVRDAMCLRLIAVANFNFWHGIDRLLHGIHHYNQNNIPAKREIQLHLVGGGAEVDTYRELTKRLKLRNVIFHGPKYGGELENIYRRAAVGVGALGLHRRQSSFQSLLKNVEYCYYGLPFIIGNPDPDFKNQPFVLEFPNDDSPIDIQKIIEWQDNLAVSAADIQHFGKAHFSWDQQINIILKTLS